MRRLAVALAGVVLGGAALLGGCGGGGKQEAAPPVALLTGVHVTPAEVVFDFRSAPDAVATRFVNPADVAESGSGRHVPVRGTSVLLVSFTPAASAEMRGDNVMRTYTGPRRVRGWGRVNEVVKVGDFEAQLQWAIGLGSRRSFRIQRDGARVAVVFGARS